MNQREGCCPQYNPNPEGYCINKHCPTIMQGRAGGIINWMEMHPENDRCPAYNSDILGKMI